MLRVRLGTSWRQDPALGAAAARGETALLEAMTQAVDALVLEVAGLDLFGGQAEGPLIGGLEGLAEALLSILAGSPRAQVSLGDGALELVVTRSGTSALLTVVTLRRPSRVITRDIDVDLMELVTATRDAIAAVLLDVRALHPTALASVERTLAHLVERLGDARPSPPPAPQRTSPGAIRDVGGGEDLPFCAFTLDEDDALLSSYRGPGADLGSLLGPGRVLVRAADGATIAEVQGAPFLILRDLVSFAGQVASTVRSDTQAHIALSGPGRKQVVDLRADHASGSVVRDGAATFVCPPLSLARAICETALELVSHITTRNPAQARNGWVASFRADAEERAAQLDELLGGDLLSPHAGSVRRRSQRPLPRAPLGPGLVRRLVFRRAWTADVGPPVRGTLSRWEGLVVAAGSSAVMGMDGRSGEVRWRRPGSSAAWARAGLFVIADGHIAAVDPDSGLTRGSPLAVSALPSPMVRDVERIVGGLVLVTVPGAIVAFDPVNDRVVWTFAPPAALELRATAFGPLVLASSDTGFLYALEGATGQPRWRIHLPGPMVAPPISYAGTCLVACETRLGGSLVSLDAATGHRGFEVPLDVTPTGAPVPFAGLLAVPGTVGGDALVTAVDPAGALAWEEATALGAGAVAVAALPSGLVAKTADGACTALDRDGEPLWSRGATSDHLAPANPPPVIARRVALVPSERVDAIDPRSGALLGEVPILEPVELLGSAALDAWGVDVDGIVTAARLETHLSVVRGRS